MKPRPRKRTRRDGRAFFGVTVTSITVTSDCALTASAGFALSVIESVNGRWPLGWNGAGIVPCSAPAGSSAASLWITAPSTATVAVPFGVKPRASMLTSWRSVGSGPAVA